ncbi:MAG: hypothetical protein F4Z31_01805 [Gemmatimonadetes bacterium]|nr:hypothetical protein [Gemmatimonadota bacterium]
MGPVGWWQRADPYWEESLFDAALEWSCRPSPGGGGFIRSSAPFPVADNRPARDARDRDAEAADIDEEDLIELRRRAVGTLALAGVMSVEQSAALAGVGSLDGYRLLFEPLSAAGITEGSWHHASAAPHPRVLLWRIRKAAPYDRFVRASLIDGDTHRWWCGADPWSGQVSRGHVRHQVLAVELALRALETDTAGRWAGWLPEGVCLPEQFCPPGHPARNGGHRVRADGCLVRVDGAPVWLEVQTGTSQAEADDKVRRWSELMHAGDGLAGLVLFVVAPRHPKTSLATTVVKRAITETAPESLKDRFWVCVWDDLSPDHCQLSHWASPLRAARLTDSGWEPSTIAEAPVAGADASLPSRMAGLGPVPAWLSRSGSCHEAAL